VNSSKLKFSSSSIVPETKLHKEFVHKNVFPDQVRFHHMISVCLLLSLLAAASANVPINIAFHWYSYPPLPSHFKRHLHQPIYYPYESVVETINQNRFPYSVADIFTSRTGPYTAWPLDAISTAASAGLGHCGAQISLTGALQENLNNLANSSVTGNFNTWTQRWKQSLSMKTSLGKIPHNPLHLKVRAPHLLRNF
jgi:hypothetical protein